MDQGNGTWLGLEEGQTNRQSWPCFLPGNGAGKFCRSNAYWLGCDNGARLPGSVKAGSMTERPNLLVRRVSALFASFFWVALPGPFFIYRD